MVTLTINWFMVIVGSSMLFGALVGSTIRRR